MFVSYTLPPNGIATFTWPAGGTTPSPTIDPNAWYQVTNVNSGKCLDVRDMSTADGALLQQWSCTGGAAQAFALVARA
jgi:glucosylceramidase